MPGQLAAAGVLDHSIIGSTIVLDTCSSPQSLSRRVPPRPRRLRILVSVSYASLISAILCSASSTRSGFLSGWCCFDSDRYAFFTSDASAPAPQQRNAESGERLAQAAFSQQTEL